MSQKFKKIIIILILIIASITVSLFLSRDVFETRNYWALDQVFRVRGSVPQESPVVIVAIDEASFKELKHRWPWSPQWHAQVIDNLKEAGAKVIAFDMLLSESNDDFYPGADSVLAQAIARTSNIILAGKIETQKTSIGSSESLTAPLPLFLQANALVAVANILITSDGVPRWAKRFRSYGDSDLPTFAALCVERYSGAVAAVPSDPFLINYTGPKDNIETVSYVDVLNKQFQAQKFRDKIVLIGQTTLESQDIHETPFGSMSGVEVQANIIDTLISKRFIVPVPLLIEFSLILVLSLLGAIVALRYQSLLALPILCFITFVCIGLYFYFSLRYRFWLHFWDGLVMWLSFAGVIVYRLWTEEKNRQQIQALFGQYVSAEVVKLLLANPDKVELGGEKRQITVLFSDVRGFTALSSQRDPQEIVAILNDYFELMVGIVLKYGGTLDKYIGDGMMAYFGAPLSTGEDAQNAVLAAIEMLQVMEKLNQKWRDKTNLSIGVGIASGEAVVGNIGSPKKMEYTAIGNVVNLASRLESLNKEKKTHILIDENTINKIDSTQIQFNRLEPQNIRGISKPIEVAEVIEQIN